MNDVLIPSSVRDATEYLVNSAYAHMGSNGDGYFTLNGTGIASVPYEVYTDMQDMFVRARTLYNQSPYIVGYVPDIPRGIPINTAIADSCCTPMLKTIPGLHTAVIKAAAFISALIAARKYILDASGTNAVITENCIENVHDILTRMQIGEIFDGRMFGKSLYRREKLAAKNLLRMEKYFNKFVKSCKSSKSKKASKVQRQCMRKTQARAYRLLENMLTNLAALSSFYVNTTVMRLS